VSFEIRRRSKPVGVFSDNGTLGLDVYLRHIGGHGYLSRAGELALFNQLDEAYPERLAAKPGASFPVNCRPIVAEISGYYYKLVVAVANGYKGGHTLPFADLIQAGNEGLLRAIWRFDQSRGHRFSTYATYWIRQAVLRAIPEQGRAIRLPVYQYSRWVQICQLIDNGDRDQEPDWAEIARKVSTAEAPVTPGGAVQTFHLGLRSLTVSLDEQWYPEEEETDKYATIAAETPGAEALMEKMDAAEVINRALDKLPARLAKIISLRFGLSGDAPLILEDIAKKFGLTRERVRQLEKEALVMLRQNGDLACLVAKSETEDG